LREGKASQGQARKDSAEFFEIRMNIKRKRGSTMRQNSVLTLLLATVFAGGAIVYAAEKFLYPDNDAIAAMVIAPTYADLQLASNDLSEEDGADSNLDIINRYDPEAAVAAAMAEQLGSPGKKEQ
jgi:hypothetical protein